ncbi:MAG: response regulator transcription factor [Aquabacterium sp.]|nr:MAG: response regulator transcription factor [Aquabacterium sp.]TAL16588.1 MAG: response regulator transcription factor [Aquabacterium sp.]
MIRLGLFDDHEIVRAGFRYILGQSSDIQIAAEGQTGREALAAVRTQDLHVCLVDLSMPDLSGIDVLKQAKAIRPETAVLILSAYSEEQYGLNVLKAGASGFLSKDLASDQLVNAVRTVAAGRRYVSPRLAEMLAAGLTDDIEQPPHQKLSEREFQIFSKLVVGRSVSDIANDLCLSAKTVSTYRSRLLEKMGFKSNAELAQYAVKNNLIS